jgi:hypothetical protein
MWYLIVIIILTFGFIFTNKISAQTKDKLNKNKEIKSKEKLKIVNDSIKPLYSKEQIEEKLKHLAETTPPTDLSFGAMCYSIAISSTDKFTYICPICGERTIYKKSKLDNEDWWNVKWILESGLSSCRREVEKISGINIQLDESQFCGHCSPNIKKPELCLLVNIGGESDTSKVCNINYLDIRKIQEFLNGELIHKTGNDGEVPLVNDIEWFKQLFGFELKVIKNE